MKKLIVCLLAVAVAKASEGQTFSRYIIQLKNKATSPYSLNSPLSYLSQRAIDRRVRYGIGIDSTDLPVTPRYLDSIQSAGAVTVLNVSRWLNQVSIQTTDAAAIQKINNFTFVQTVAPVAARLGGNSGSGKKEIKAKSPAKASKKANHYRTTADYYNYGQSYNQVHIHNGEFLHNIGLRGQNMIIGMLDAGFRSYTSLRAFDSVNINGQVLGTYDFVAREQSVVEDDAHGMQCFSIIAGNIPGQFVGTAPKASFYLFRSEDSGSEYPIEEHNWVVAAERLDSAGGDLISSSLGYSDGMSNTIFDHAYAEMNGNTTIAARGADMAAKKGILVVNSAGNSGSSPFHFIATPADGDSVMAVGAVTKDSVVAGFSSYGPSSDGQVKPDVASVGANTFLQTTANTIGTSNGTSFSCPNMAGLAACLWQGFREFNNIKILNALRQAGHKASSPDDRVGYGIPDVKKAVMNLVKEFSTASVTASSCRNTINWTSKDMNEMRYEIERKISGATSFTKIGEQQGKGLVFGTNAYQFSDTLINVQAGTISYRIRQVIDATSATLTADYIDTVSITLANSCVTTGINPIAASAEAIILQPNPAREKFTVKITTAYPVQNLVIRIANTKGQILTTERKTKGTGTTSFDFSTYQWASGKYYVSFYNNEKVIGTKELIKL
ncbi:MAG: T9SS type A sorting domain-containing protein [Chitinophagaceae bacterium]|nr:MAG: T9SS type A sorting domain-containing protein [Chitinophagaceae bacterium]